MVIAKRKQYNKNDVMVFACTRKSFFTAHFPFSVICYYQCIWRHGGYSNQYHKINSHYWMQDIKSYWFCYSFGTNDHTQIILVFMYFYVSAITIYLKKIDLSYYKSVILFNRSIDHTLIKRTNKKYQITSHIWYITWYITKTMEME